MPYSDSSSLSTTHEEPNINSLVAYDEDQRIQLEPKSSVGLQSSVTATTHQVSLAKLSSSSPLAAYTEVEDELHLTCTTTALRELRETRGGPVTMTPQSPLPVDGGASAKVMDDTEWRSVPISLPAGPCTFVWEDHDNLCGPGTHTLSFNTRTLAKAQPHFPSRGAPSPPIIPIPFDTNITNLSSSQYRSATMSSSSSAFAAADETIEILRDIRSAFSTAEILAMSVPPPWFPGVDFLDVYPAVAPPLDIAKSPYCCVPLPPLINDGGVPCGINVSGGIVVLRDGM